MNKFNQLTEPFSKYEISESKSIVRSVKTKSIVSFDKGANTIRLMNDNGERKIITKENLKTLSIMTETKEVPKLKIKKDKPKLVSGSKILTGVVPDAPIKKEKQKNGETRKQEDSITFKINLMIHQGVEKEKIISDLGITNKQFLDKKWLYTNKGYKEKIEKYLSSK